MLSCTNERLAFVHVRVTSFWIIFISGLYHNYERTSGSCLCLLTQDHFAFNHRPSSAGLLLSFAPLPARSASTRVGVKLSKIEGVFFQRIEPSTNLAFWYSTPALRLLRSCLLLRTKNSINMHKPLVMARLELQINNLLQTVLANAGPVPARDQSERNQRVGTNEEVFISGSRSAPLGKETSDQNPLYYGASLRQSPYVHCLYLRPDFTSML